MTRFQIGLYSNDDLAPSCRARGEHVCIRYPLRARTEPTAAVPTPHAGMVRPVGSVDVREHDLGRPPG